MIAMMAWIITSHPRNEIGEKMAVLTRSQTMVYVYVYAILLDCSGLEISKKFLHGIVFWKLFTLMCLINSHRHEWPPDCWEVCITTTTSIIINTIHHH